MSLRTGLLVCVVVGIVGVTVLLVVLLATENIRIASASSAAGAAATLAAAPPDLRTCAHVERASLDASTSGVLHMHGVVGVPQLRLFSALRSCTAASAAPASAAPNARLVSNALFVQTPAPPSPLASLTWSFGQLVDHDIVLTRTHAGTSACPAMHIATQGDPTFGARGPIVVAPSVLQFNAVSGEYATLAGITNFVDASAVYGSEAGRSYHLRAFAGGELRTGAEGATLPRNTVGLENVGGDANTAMFLAGDVRSSEQAPLAAWHTLWLREHNYQARRLAASSMAGASDECLYQAARTLVIAEFQRAVFDDFVPALLDGVPLPPYGGYRPNVDARIAVEFSAAAYRLGHSMVNDVIFRANASTGAALPSIGLRHTFKRPDALLVDIGIDEYFAGALRNRAEVVDARVVDALRQHLFEDEGAPLDLVAINIVRGRELNLSSFATVRAHFATSAWPAPAATRDASDASRLGTVYGTRPIDLYVGLLTEAPARPNGVLGRTLEALVREQFTRLRDGDPRYYRAVNDASVLAYVGSAAGSLRSILLRNTALAPALVPSTNVFEFVE
jgi:hypothetical protein